jgi:hypothetical protein
MPLKDKMDKLKKVFSGQDDEDEHDIVTQVSDATTFSWETRLKGFIICFALGVVCSLLSTFLLFVPGGGLIAFAILYTFGNVMAICSTFFLMGPCNQIKRMFAETRIIATIIVIVCLALTLCAALWWKLPGLAILFCILQFLAMTWYGLSYIPFARDAIKKCFTSCIN